MVDSSLIFPLILTFLAGLYNIIIVKYMAGWRALKEWDLPKGFLPKTAITIIVPARNEEKNILACLRSISKNNYPADLLEVIVMDDHSTDGTYELVKNFEKENPCFRPFRLADFLQKKEISSFKKKALEIAIEKASGELIITTDADCIVTENWLALLVSFYEKNKFQFIAAPVNFHEENSIFERFQSLDFLGMMGVTGAGLQLGWMKMCNGANLAYTKRAFNEVDGFHGIDHLASGDDILLMQKIAARFPHQIGFLKNKNATVKTLAKPDVTSFFSQRMRWATKNASYQEWKITFILAVVFFYCSGIILSLLGIPFFGWKWAVLFLVLFFNKAIFDYFFLGGMAAYFERKNLMKSFWPSQIFHILYIVIIGTMSNFKKRYKWKGREVR